MNGNDETTRSPQEHRAERYLEPARVDRFRTSVYLTWTGFNALPESSPWMRGSFSAVGFGIGRDVAISSDEVRVVPPSRA